MCGYPPEDLLLMPKFLLDISRMRDRIAKVTAGIMAVVGSVVEPDHRRTFAGQIESLRLERNEIGSGLVFCYPDGLQQVKM